MSKFSKDSVFAALKTLAKIFWPPIVVFSAHLTRMIIIPLDFQYDMLMHLLGGLSIALTVSNGYKTLRSKNLATEFNYLEFAYLLIASTALVGVLWEFMEFLFFQDFLERLKVNLYVDTISDLSLDLLGATLWAAIEGFRKNQSRDVPYFVILDRYLYRAPDPNRHLGKPHRVTPLIVVPSQNFEQIGVNHFSKLEINHG